MNHLGLGVCYQESYFGENVIEKELGSIELVTPTERWDDEE